MKVIVTGAAGFIGGHIAKTMLKLGHEVLGIDNLSTSGKEFLPILIDLGMKFEKIDITDEQGVENVFASFCPDVVFHHAAYAFVAQSFENPDFVKKVNELGTKIIGLSCSKHKTKLVYASTSAVYGDCKSPQHTSDKASPTSPYANSKLNGEIIIEKIKQNQGLCAIGLRYFNVYGPYQSTAYGSVIPTWFTCAKNKESIKIFGRKDISRDFTYVDDVVNANIKAANILKEKNNHHEIFNVGTEKSTSLNLLSKIIKNICKKYSIDVKIDSNNYPARKGDVYKLLAGDKNILKNTKTIDINEGLEKSSWFYMKEKK